MVYQDVALGAKVIELCKIIWLDNNTTQMSTPAYKSNVFNNTAPYILLISDYYDYIKIIIYFEVHYYKYQIEFRYK